MRARQVERRDLRERGQESPEIDQNATDEHDIQVNVRIERRCARTNAGRWVGGELSLGEELGLSVVDNFYSMDPTKASREHFFRDGLHLSAEGNQKVFNNIVTIIERDFPELNPEKNEMVWPHWSKVVENPGVL